MPTDYIYPSSVEEAIGCLERYGGQARIIAGGTDLLPDLRQGKAAPRCLVDITRIPGLDQITVEADQVEVGAAVTFAQLKDHPILSRRVHALVEAARSVGALPIQTAATWVGNLVQAMPAADGAIVAVALEAEARLVDRSGAAWRPVETLFRGPGISAIDPCRQMITHLRFPLPHGRWGTAWRRLGRRPSLVLPILNCAVALRLSADGSQITASAVAVGPVAPCPCRMRRAEASCLGQPPTAALFAEAGRLAQAEAQPRGSVMRASRRYRLQVLPALVAEALAVAAQRANTQKE